MWRSMRLARKAFLGSASKFRAPQHHARNPQVLQSYHESLLPPLAASCYHYSQLSHFTSRVSFQSRFDRNPRFYSSDPYPEEDELFTEKPIVDSGNGLDENLFGANDNGFDDGNAGVWSVDSSLDFSSESVGEIEKFDVVEGEDDNVSVSDVPNNTDAIEDMVQKLEDLLSLLQSSGSDKSLESCLEGLDLVLNEDFVLRVLETPLVPGESLIEFIQWGFKKNEDLVTKKVIDALVGAISKELIARNSYALWDLVKYAGGKDLGIVSTETLNELLSLFSRLGKGKVAFEVFNKFEDFGCVPDADTYYFTISALCRRKLFDWACSVCEKMVSADKLQESDKVGEIISLLCKGNRPKDAHNVYLWAKERKMDTSRSLNFLISSLCKINKMMSEVQTLAKETHSPSQYEAVEEEEKECIHLALKMLDDFPEKERTYAIKPFSSVFVGLCRMREFEGAQKLLFQMMESGPPPGHGIFNTIITGLSKAGELEEARKMLKIMEDRGLKPDVYSYTVIISGYVEGGEMEVACEVFHEAKKKHSKLSSVTYHSMIRGFCKLEQFDRALGLLEDMKKSGVRPNADEYNKLIKSVCMKDLDWKTATKLLEEMVEMGLHPNEKTKCLVRAVKELQEETTESQAVEAAV
ncbi:OLC1v1025513C1 [Oldenlandia corymbosa var. corymbosa]|uniref:OLC1v1025513C1 n=1 Tax=Oldenlandia corymbosa var. corymbosa TaxID=529605 RepID=A0AAV1C740_OLDCO|nr:OLC1v1025513C1 [Oldenlandia corymbosa var. corymbosa]